MSMIRASKRNIARNRMKDAGYDKVNRRMSMTSGGAKQHIKMVERTHRGQKNSRKRRAYIDKVRAADPQIWRRVFSGDLEKKAVEAWKTASFRRAIASEARKMEAKRRGYRTT